MPNNDITLRSDKNSFLTFEEADINFLRLREVIDEFNHFVGTTYSDQLDNFNDLEQDLADYKVYVAGRLWKTVQSDRENKFTAKNTFTHKLIANDATVTHGRADDFEIGQATPKKGTFTELKSTESFKLPTWRTSTRPTPQTGIFGYNLDLKKTEIYKDGSWSGVNADLFGGHDTTYFAKLNGDSSEQFKVKNPSSSKDAANKGWVENKDYVPFSKVSKTKTSNSVVQRDSSGRIECSDPTSENDAATAGWTKGRFFSSVHTPSRSKNTKYTNTHGVPMLVYCNAGEGGCKIEVDGKTFEGSHRDNEISAIVPPGKKYQFKGAPNMGSVIEVY